MDERDRKAMNNERQVIDFIESSIQLKSCLFAEWLHKENWQVRKLPMWVKYIYHTHDENPTWEEKTTAELFKMWNKPNIK